MAKNGLEKFTGSSVTGESALFKVLHWLIAVLIVFQGLLGAANLRIAWLQDHLASAIVVHEEIGLLILLLTLSLFIVRVITGRRSGAGAQPSHQLWAKMVHGAFYGLIFVECAIGIWIMGLLGKGLTILAWHMPLPITADPHFAFSTVLQWHAAVALTLAFLIVIHSLAALYHHYVLRDHTLTRMLPVRLSRTDPKS
ncbi:cytochrome b [Acidithiobacillus thiooxidans]|uniref:Cytochrome b561 n=1 Tax=Acidithiobacillus thiooxidans ATCC 19377 TaxID=637390 RepID=A0A543Q7H8_ACITH|nr:cytochrome b/b6 domain-containing protein [Acidithiobacillus thiooxidans]MDX5936219.1 cytochrome b/b6 domain-containing protein [Acidithiobacillus thiooxidans]TQN52275.1 Cytochrome b561 [Acidithiobacillus thiooxidans ATCC 19377]